MSRLRRIERGDQMVGSSQGSDDSLYAHIQAKLLSEFGPSIAQPSPEIRSKIEERFSAILTETNVELSRTEKARLFEVVTLNILGWGPLETLIADETISDIVI